MQLVPVLEIRHGKCVHTEPKNDFVDHVVKESVSETLERWLEKGITRIHIVDVDAIESGEPENVDLVASLKREHPEVEIQVLGGVKCIESAYIWMDAGVDYLVLNGKAIRQRNLLDDICVEFPGKVMVELDCRHGQVAMGTGEPTFTLESIARQLDEDGVVGLVITEIPDKGHVNSQSLLKVMELSETLEMPIYANGGIEKIADLKSVLANQAKKLTGVLLGKPLYNGFCLGEARLMIEQYQADNTIHI